MLPSKKLLEVVTCRYGVHERMLLLAIGPARVGCGRRGEVLYRGAARFESGAAIGNSAARFGHQMMRRTAAVLTLPAAVSRTNSVKSPLSNSAPAIVRNDRSALPDAAFSQPTA